MKSIYNHILSSSDHKLFLESWFFIRDYYFITNDIWNLLRFTLYILDIIPYFSIFFIIREIIMDGVYVIFILMVTFISFDISTSCYLELYLMVHIFIIQILGFLELLLSSS